MPQYKDRLLEFAYTLYLEAQCDICGGSKFECRNEANAGLYEIAETTCHRQAAVEEHTGQQGFKPEPGQRFYAREIDEELITRRTFSSREYSDQIAESNDDQSGNQHGEADNKPELRDERDYG